ncbi:type IV secretory system conjugative DNA transfer family protein [Paracoccus sp. YLB-12]|uniref:Type IV secretory system conjugative DNA transfer family protein n=1 Tax=Paracoccus maritimus TaxID=2933292 RepID=A0ABT2KEL7_9RHOB|nr:type IV secretory system conjugative DNA transfer family protein [Paracoccus sp. YLB-12]MCT4334394.1 type IV secretory system conjugative DNA transfer family protein [Paracoccus sp. YLB-12]
MSRVIGRLFRFLAGSAAMAIAVPWLLFQLAVLLLLASGAAIVTFMLVRALILGEAVVTDPTSAVGRLGFLVVQLAFWALAVRFWAYLHGFDHLFARRGNSHGSARFSSKAERAGKAEREAASVMSNAQRHTRFLDSPRIIAALSRTEVDFADLRRGVTSIFLVLPPNRLDAYSRWLHLMVSQALQDIARAAERPADALNGPGSATEALEAPEEAQERGKSPDRRTTAPLARDLLTPDEIMQMPAHLQLLRVQGQPVMLAEKLRYYADPRFRDLFTPQPA